MLRDGAYRMATKGKERKAMDLTTLLIGPNLAKGDFLAKSGGSRATIGRASA
jgi:hypothetical protein